MGYITAILFSINFGSEFKEPEQVSKALRLRGLSQVIDEFYHSDSWEDYFLPGVESGNPAWLEVARVIGRGTDAGASEELDGAFAKALVKAPYKTLPVLHEIWWHYNDAKICVFGYDSELPGGVQSYVTTLQHALAAKPPDEIKSLRSKCLQGLTKTMEDIRRVGYEDKYFAEGSTRINAQEKFITPWELTGIVVSDTGVPLAGVTVQSSESVITDENGRYLLKFQPGNYSNCCIVKFHRVGYQPVTKTVACNIGLIYSRQPSLECASLLAPFLAKFASCN